MKNLMLSGLVAASLLMLSSCLEGGSNVVSRTATGIITFHAKSAKLVVASPDFYPYAFYDPQFASNLNGLNLDDCVLFSYTVDLNAAENSNVQTTEVYQGTMTNVSMVDDYMCEPYMMDTTTLLANEQKIAYAIDANYGFDVINEVMFLYSDLTMFDGQKNRWYMYYNPDVEPVKDSATDTNVYSLFLRTVIMSAGKAPSQDMAVINAFRMGYYFNRIKTKERNLGNTKAIIRINYIKNIKEDGSFVWDKSDINMDVPKED